MLWLKINMFRFAIWHILCLILSPLLAWIVQSIVDGMFINDPNTISWAQLTVIYYLGLMAGTVFIHLYRTIGGYWLINKMAKKWRLPYRLVERYFVIYDLDLHALKVKDWARDEFNDFVTNPPPSGSWFISFFKKLGWIIP